MLYLLIVLISSIIIYVINSLTNPSNVSLPWVYYLVVVLIFVAAAILIDGIVAFVIRRLPPKYMNPKKGMILTRPWEEKLFKKLHVDKWKKFMPDLGKFTNFQKGKISDPFNNEYIDRYILEASYGVVIHYLSVPFSLLILLLGLIDLGNIAILTIGLPVTIINMVLIYLPTMSLKYNIPKLLRIKEINAKREKK